MNVWVTFPPEGLSTKDRITTLPHGTVRHASQGVQVGGRSLQGSWAAVASGLGPYEYIGEGQQKYSFACRYLTAGAPRRPMARRCPVACLEGSGGCGWLHLRSEAGAGAPRQPCTSCAGPGSSQFWLCLLSAFPLRFPLSAHQTQNDIPLHLLLFILKIFTEALLCARHTDVKKADRSQPSESLWSRM